jgi:hypothetical protein
LHSAETIHGCGDGAEGRISRGRVGGREYRVVRHVEHLAAQLEGLQDRRVELIEIPSVRRAFGQTTAAFCDFNNTNDPGSRTLEFVMRINF